MHFTLATATDKNAVEELWAYSFEPRGDAFFEFYFKECYVPQDTLLAWDKVKTPVIENEQLHFKETNKIIGNMHLRRYQWVDRFNHRAHNLRYIVGVSTDPDYRSGGVGKKMLTAALEHLDRQNEALTILMPSKAGFYQPHGWALYCHQFVRKMSLDNLRPLINKNLIMRQIKSLDEWIILAQIYDQYTQNKHGYTLRSKTKWQELIKGLWAEGVNIVVVYSTTEKPLGYMFYKLGSPEIFVSEMIYLERKAQKALLGYLYQHRSQGESVRWNEWLGDKGYIFYPDGKEGNSIMPFMMLRIINVCRLFTDLKIAASKLLKLNKNALIIEIKDPLIDSNNGFYRLEADVNECIIAKKLDTRTEMQFLSMDISTLALLVAGSISVLDLFYVEEQISGDEYLLPLLDAIFPMAEAPAFINEWY